MSCPLLKCCQTCVSPFAPEGRPECLTVRKSVFLGIAIGEAVGVASSVIHGAGWCVSWGPFQMAPLVSSFLALGGSRSIWAELEGLLAREIVFIQCIHNQAPYLSVHLSLSRTHTLPTSGSAPRPTRIIHSLTLTQYSAQTRLETHAHTELNFFFSLCLYSSCLITHIWGRHIYHACPHKHTDTCIVSLVGLCFY